MNIKTIDAKVIQKCFLAGANAIDAKKEKINDLNVGWQPFLPHHLNKRPQTQSHESGVPANFILYMTDFHFVL